MPLYWGSKKIEGVSVGLPGIHITDLCPQIICADNHLRDVVEIDGAAYVRIGFYELGAFSKSFALTVTRPAAVNKAIAIGPGGYGGAADANASGAGGGCGEYVEAELQLNAGNYTVACGYGVTTKLLDADGNAILTANAGMTPEDGTGTEGSSVSGLPGNDGYLMDIQPSKFNFGYSDYVSDTGAGIGAGGGGQSNLLGSSEVKANLMRGLGGGIFFYVRLS